MGIVVLGMHRSGTSLITRVLNFMGFTLGKDARLFEPHPVHNPTGYWERYDLVLLNNKVLYSLSCDWWKVSSLDLARIPDNVLSEFNTASAEIIQGLSKEGNWVIKDPRFPILFPLWKELFHGSHLINVFRNPIEVAMSLQSRDKCPLHFGLALWEYYILTMAGYFEDQTCITIDYNAFLKKPLEQTEKVFHTLVSKGVENLVLPTSEDLLKFIDKDLYREKSTQKLEKQLLTSHQKEIWDCLKKEDMGTIRKMATIERYTYLTDILKMYEAYVELQISSTSRETTSVSQSEIDHKNQEIRKLKKQVETLESKIGHQDNIQKQINDRFDAIDRTLSGIEGRLTGKPETDKKA